MHLMPLRRIAAGARPNETHMHFTKCLAPSGSHVVKAVSVVLIAAMSSGCSVMPSQVAGPDIKPAGPEERNAGLKAQYVLNGKSVIYDKAFDESPAIMPVETTINGVQSQAMSMKGAYLDRQKYLLGEIDVVSNFQFVGIVVSAIGVATKSNAVRNSGAGAAGLSNLWSSHYALTVQAVNYGLAAQAMDCLSTEISSVAPSFWQLAYTPEGVFKSSRADFVLAGVSEADTNTAYNALAGMYVSLHSAIGKIDLKLRTLQSKVVLSTVTVADIQSAVTGQAAAKKGADATDGKPLLDAAKNAAQTAKQAVNEAQQKVTDKKAEYDHAVTLTDSAKDKFTAEDNRLQSAKDKSLTAKADLSEFDSVQMNTQSVTPQNQRNLFQKRLSDADSEKKQSQARRDVFKTALDDESVKLNQLNLELRNLQAAAATAQKEADDKQNLVNLLKWGVVGRASQVPANVNACVVAMGN